MQVDTPLTKCGLKKSMKGWKRRKLAGNTYVELQDDGEYHLKLHGKVIAVLHVNGEWTLSHCGYRTRTTKDRLNRFTPARIFQKAGEWYHQIRRVDIPFYNGLRLNHDGYPVVRREDALREMRELLTEMMMDGEVTLDAGPDDMTDEQVVKAACEFHLIGI